MFIKFNRFAHSAGPGHEYVRSVPGGTRVWSGGAKNLQNPGPEGPKSRSGGVLGRLGGVLGRLVGVLGASWGILGRLGASSGRPGGVLGASWGVRAEKKGKTKNSEKLLVLQYLRAPRPHQKRLRSCQRGIDACWKQSTAFAVHQDAVKTSPCGRKNVLGPKNLSQVPG